MDTIILPSAEDLAQNVKDGMKIAVFKDEAGGEAALGLAKAIIRRGLRDLHLVTIPTCAWAVSGLMADMLIGAGCVGTVETSGISLGEVGRAPRFAAAVKSGSIRLLDATCPAIYAALQAGAKGIPFIPLRGIIGSDLLANRADDWRVIENPFAENDPIVALKAINPDVSIFHAQLADRFGNVWIGRNRDLLIGAHASSQTLVTVERIVDGDLMADERTAAGTIPGFYVTAIAEDPGGCWPIPAEGMGAAVTEDVTEDVTGHVREYARMAQSEAGFGDYLERYVMTGREAAQ